VRAIKRVEREFNVLDNLDLSQRLSDDDFDKQVAEQQARLNLLQRRAGRQGVSTILVFEGWDAAGKGGAIRRVTSSLDARDYQVIPIAAPTDEERAHHYLWRFWRHLSRKGRLTIFDRSWYGRLLVERVEGFATEAEYTRAYGEIDHFEEQLVNHGILLLKFWIHISKAEQLRRFKDRSSTSYKRWKITDEDWRNRKRWEDYTSAVNDMVARTSTKIAPWALVEGNDKNFARIKVLRTVADALDRRLKK
jgi:polyphosphate kinase 2 (PPK2 family)